MNFTTIIFFLLIVKQQAFIKKFHNPIKINIRSFNLNNINNKKFHNPTKSNTRSFSLNDINNQNIIVNDAVNKVTDITKYILNYDSLVHMSDLWSVYGKTAALFGFLLALKEGHDRAYKKLKSSLDYELPEEYKFFENPLNTGVKIGTYALEIAIPTMCSMVVGYTFTISFPILIFLFKDYRTKTKKNDEKNKTKKKSDYDVDSDDVDSYYL